MLVTHQKPRARLVDGKWHLRPTTVYGFHEEYVSSNFDWCVAYWWHDVIEFEARLQTIINRVQKF